MTVIDITAQLEARKGKWTTTREKMREDMKATVCEAIDLMPDKDVQELVDQLQGIRTTSSAHLEVSDFAFRFIEEREVEE